MSALMGSLSFLSIYLYVIVPLAPIIYIFVKWRSYRDGDPQDPQLGTKTVLYYFKTMGYHVLLAGSAFILYSVFKGKGGDIRIGIGLLLSGGIIYIVQSFLIHKLSNTIEYPFAGRLYTGFNLIITGIVGMVAFIYTTVSVIKASPGFEFPLACFIIYTLAWGFQTALFCKPGVMKNLSPFRRLSKK